MRLSLQTKLISTTLLVAITVSVVLTTLSFNELKESSQKGISSEANAQTKAFTKFLERWTESKLSSATAIKLAIEAELSKGEAVNKQEILKILNHGKNSVGFSLTFLGMEDGVMIRNTNKDVKGYDPRVRGWYKAAKAANETIISKPFISASAKKMAITFASPIIVNNQFIGAIGGLVFMDEILTSVLDLKVQGEGYAMLLDTQSNIVVAHPNEELILKDTTVLNESLDSAAISQLIKEPELTNMELLNENSVLYMSSIGGTHWAMSLVMNQDALNQPINKLLINSLLVIAVILVFTAVCVILLIRWLFSDLKHVSEGLSNIANGDGDLTLRINTKSKDEIGLLANNFNSFVEYLHGIISRVSDVSNELTVQATATADQASNSATKVKVQQDEITLVAGAIKEMTTATQDIAANAINAASTADDAVALSNSGQDQVRKSQDSINALALEVTSASEVITDLDKHAQEISSILATISGIAEQTNLLALNAAIEAARAGEQGRGFAVVADEVRVLSQRTHSSTEEIQNMIEVLQKTTQNAVKSMATSKSLTGTSVADAETASESLSVIRDSIATINDMATKIATAAEEQTCVTKEINSNTTNINKAAEDLAKESDEGSSRSQHLNSLTDSLKSDINRFKL